MAYYFSCRECNHIEYFGYLGLKVDNKIAEQFNVLGGQLSEGQTVLCSSCISKKTRLKGNHLIIERK
tara:strand:+ start:360 stop:560 length:201 start_codon:yes stop_codon:yes gene_type:complete